MDDTNLFPVPEKLSPIKLGIVCPMANEKKTVELFVPQVLNNCRGFKSVDFFAVIDRVSTDNTLDLLNQLKLTYPEINIVWAPEDRNVVDAYVRGYKEALNAGSDWILEIDAGFSHQPSQIPQFFDKMLEGYDCIFGSRFCKGGKISNSSRFRRFISHGGTVVTNLLLGTKLHDMTSGFELFTREALTCILRKGINSKGHFFQTEIKAHAKDLNIAEVPIHYQSASPGINSSVLLDAFKNLFILTKNRFKSSKKI